MLKLIKYIHNFTLKIFIYLDLRDANHSDFCGIIPVFKAALRITIWNVKIMANYDFKMGPDKITRVTSTSTPVIPDHQ